MTVLSRHDRARKSLRGTTLSHLRWWIVSVSVGLTWTWGCDPPEREPAEESPLAAILGEPTLELDEEGLPVLPAPQAIDGFGRDGREHDALFAETLERARRRLLSSPSSPAAWGALGEVYQAHKYFRAATYAYRRAVELEGRPSENRAAWTHLLGVLARETGDPTTANALFTLAFQDNGRSLPSGFGLAMSRLELNELDRAEAAFRDLGRISPDGPWAPYGLGLVAQRRGELQDAQQHLERALELDSELPRARYALGIVLRDLGEVDRARELLASVTAPGPTRPPDPILERVLRKQTSLASRIDRGNQLLAEGLPQEAENEYRTVIGYDESSFDGHYNLGVLLGRTGRYDEARSHLEIATTLEPERADAHYVLAMAYASLGEIEAARDAVARSLAIRPQDERAQQLRAQLGG